MIFVGLDLSLTATGVCLLFPGNDHFESGITEKTKLKGCERLKTLKIEIIEWVNLYTPDLIAIEGYSYGSKGHLASIGELGGIIKLELYMIKIPTIIIPPTSLKKFVTGKGNANKEKMQEVANKKWGVTLFNDNENDAYCLAQMAKAHKLGTEVKYEQEALKGVEVLK